MHTQRELNQHLAKTIIENDIINNSGMSYMNEQKKPTEILYYIHAMCNHILKQKMNIRMNKKKLFF